MCGLKEEGRAFWKRRGPNAFDRAGCIGKHWWRVTPESTHQVMLPWGASWLGSSNRRPFPRMAMQDTDPRMGVGRLFYICDRNK